MLQSHWWDFKQERDMACFMLRKIRLVWWQDCRKIRIEAGRPGRRLSE
jgi:hypothetical protein